MVTRLFATCILAGCSVMFPIAIGQESPKTERLHMDASTLDSRFRFAANSIDRDAPTLNWSTSVFHLKGDVEIRMPFKPLQPLQTAPDSHLYMVIHCDEADFNEKTSELQLRGNTRVTIEPQRL